MSYPTELLGMWYFINDEIEFLIHTFQLKICPLECFPQYVCIEKPYICNATRYVSTWVGVAHINVMTIPRTGIPGLDIVRTNAGGLNLIRARMR